MTSQQKISVVALGVFAVAAITLGLLHINRGIIDSVAWDFKPQSIEQTDRTVDEEAAELASKDTDGDGLNDYEELHVFNTSPYLSDTDGDSIEDAQEIQNGNDPNCPEGSDCSSEAGQVQEDVPTIAPINDVLAGDQLGVASADPLQELLSGGGLEPGLLRELLLQNGVDSATLQDVSDDQLVQLYSEALGQLNPEEQATEIPE